MPKKRKKSELKLARKGKTARILIQGVVGWDYFGTTARAFRQDLKDNASGANTIEVELDTPGGVVTEGIAMANAIMEQDATIHTYVSGEAASMGSVLLMAGDRMFIPANALVMVHKPLNAVLGNADEMRKQADDLDKFEKAMMSMYMRHFKGTEDQMAELMRAETWLTADDMEAKFNNVTVMKNELKAVACSEPVSYWASEAPSRDTEEDDKSLFSRFMAWYRTTAFSNTASALEADLAEETETQEEEMTPEQEASIVAKVTEGVLAALKQDVEAPKELAPKAEAPKIEFKGDPNSAEDVQAHINAVNDAQLVAAVDWSDVNSVLAYQKAKFGKVSATLPHGNVGTPAGSEASKEKDLEETRACFDKYM